MVCLKVYVFPLFSPAPVNNMINDNVALLPKNLRSVRILTVATSYSSYTNSRFMRSLLKPSKSSAWNVFNKINENEVQFKLCQAKLACHKLTTTMLCHLGVKSLAESGLLPANQPSTNTCVTTVVLLSRMRAFWSVMAFVQVEHIKTITEWLEKLYNDKE